MIRIFWRYMALRFLKPFFFGLGVFAVLIFLADLFDKMPRLARSPANLLLILQYLWLEVPYWGVRIIPMATLLATLYAVTGFVRSGEWIAVQAAGFEPRAFFRPLLLMAGLVTLGSFAAQETVLPACFARSQRLWRDRIFPAWEYDVFHYQILIARPGQFITTPLFTVGKGKLERPVMDYYQDGRVVRELDAREGAWDPAVSRWIFKDGVERTFGSEGGLSEKPFSTATTDLDMPPKDLAPRGKNPDEMSLLETRRYLRQVRRSGGSVREARAALHGKLAYPFANLILCALGIPIALRFGRGSKTVSFGLALGASFAYLWVMEMGRALGVADRVHPAAAAWMPNLMFGTLALWLNRRYGA